MEFFNQSKKSSNQLSNRLSNPYSMKKSSSTEIDKLQISLIHIWGTVYTVKRYLASNGITINDKWENCPEWVNDYLKIEEYIDKMCESGIFEIRAADTLKPIVDWVKSKNWKLPGLEALAIAPNSILVAMRSHLKYNSYELQTQFSISEKRYMFNGNSITAVNINGAILKKDKFGNVFGFYRYQNEYQGTTTVRITKLENGDPYEVIKNHFTDEGSTKMTEEYMGMSFLPMNIKLGTGAMRSLNGAENGSYQVQMVAADGFIQIDHQKFNYEMKSIALVVYRGGGRNDEAYGCYKMYDIDDRGNAIQSHPLLVEIINNGVNFISVIINSDDIGNIN